MAIASSFASDNLRIIIFAAFCIGCFQITASQQHDENEHDEMGMMAAHEFDEVDVQCSEPPPPMHANMQCFKHKTKKNKYVCRAKCNRGFQFPNGNQTMRHMCDLTTGKWNKFNFPDCIRICDPACEHGGACTEENYCVCTPEYRGDRCQYEVSLCDPKIGLHVSGEWICNSSHTDTRCVLKCPQGTRYETQPADLYICSLDGAWTPSFAPKCIPINVIEPPTVQHFYAISGGEPTQSKIPATTVCSTWSSNHYRTFDGGIYSFSSPCTYLFSKDCEQDTFAIHVQNGQPCPSWTSCPTAIIIYIGSEEYVLKGSEGGAYIMNKEQKYEVPAAVDGLLLQMLSEFVTVSSPLGFKLKWNLKNTILLEVSTPLKNRTCGLCGKFDGLVVNDFGTSDGSITDSVESFVDSWAMENLGEKCEGKAVVKDACSENKDKVEEAVANCQIIFDDKFSSCHQLVNPKPYFETCRMDYCGCESEASCHCSSLAEYFRECVRLGGSLPGGWRNNDLCPLSCPFGMVYKDCGSSCPQTCRGTVYDCEDDRCVDGCHCPEGTVLHDMQCIEKASCPCLHNEKEYHNGERIIQDCNACECNAGKWRCTEEQCGARCSSTGDPHYITFDGYSYEYLGSCPYYLVFNENFNVVQEYGPCSSQAGPEQATDSMFCTQSVTIEYGGGSLVLQPGFIVTFNSRPVDLPFSEMGIYAAMATDIFLKVRLDNGLSVLWDGKNRIYIDAPSSLYDQTMGLCGTFNNNQNDDFMTPEKDIEADVATFVSRWQASDKCYRRARRSMRRTPCEMQPQKLADADQLCYTLKSAMFSNCHGEIDPYAFYKSCVNDLCMCGENLEECLCPILADYSLACARKGIVMDWIDRVPICQPQCTGGQIYKECGDPCTSTCAAVASELECDSQCVQGCICPDGTALNSEGICVAVDQCPCLFEGKEFPSLDITVKGTDICKCLNAKWECRPGSEEELKALNPEKQVNPRANHALKCLEEYNEEYTDCAEPCPRTCQNFHLPSKCPAEQCFPGCKCKEGFIFDAELQKCVEMSQCGCIHGNRRYKEGETIKQSCNLCSCRRGQWQCTEQVCPGICTAWGESHFKTYDGKIFDFHGECEYILSKGKMSDASYTLIVQNVPCGTSGITCSKSFTLDLGALKQSRGDTNEVVADEEKLTLTKNDPLPKMSLKSRFVVLESGLFVLVYTDIGITLRWDRGTRIYVTLDPKWRNRVNGLCGNFNDDQADDFLTPFGGIPEARASTFADSWKIHEFCPGPVAIEDTCAIHPERKGWAQQKCGILKSDVFEPCRTAVAMEPFYERCVFDSCGCDMGGDCDCLCTAIAAYAQECSIHGVSIRWRSQELCPIQCEECATYDSCIPSCPKKTCENEYRYGRIEEACSNDFCVEGCNPKPCPAGQIYNNEVEYKCIPEVDCVVPCLEVNGVIYNEGDRVTDLEVADPCQSCHCHRGSIQCTGSRCVKQEPLRPCLKTGWTPWMNTPSFVGGDFEELTSPSLKATYEEFCGFTNMTTIECRVAETKISAQEAGQNVICELPTGLVCVDTDQNGRICEDYEIRMYCDCGPMLETTTLPPVTTPLITQPPECHANGWTAWMSSVLPSEQGEFETLERLRVNHIFCANQDIDDIECRSTRTWKYITEDTNDIICNKKVGFICNGPLCDDFEVRVHCYCGPEETTPLVIPETTPVAPKCISEWTQFYDVDHPSVSDASDDETIENIEQKEGPVCEGRNITDVECKAYVNGEYVDYSSLNLFGLKCSKKTGFVCEKFIIGEDCPNFMVRFYCSCEPTPETTTKLITTTTTTAAPTTTTTTPVPIKPVPVECGWTPWINTDTPEEGENDDGDLEDLATIQYLYKTCGGKDLVDIECRMARTHHSYELSQQHNLKCDLEHGFVCHNQDQIGKCYDYEIRLLCMYDWCYPKTTPPTTTTTTTPAPTTTANPCPDGQVYDECAYSCSQMCSSFASETVEKCSLLESGCIPACRPIDGCQLPYVWRDYFHCVPKDECPCVYTDDITNEVITAGPKAVVYKTCEKCQCLEGNLHCEIIPFCGVQPPVRRLIENIEQPDCWTKWESIDYPEGPGDLEKISEFRKVFEFCADPIKIECRTIATQQKPSDVGQNVKCDLQTGLVCFNKENEPDGCYDYEIRFYCPCPTLPPPTTTIPPPTLEPGECLYGWTEWFNNHYPDGRGDYESIQSSRVNHIFCANDMISAIECRKAGSLETGLLQRGVECDLQVGVICRQESLGEQEYCWDYEVRFFCDCPISTVVPYEIPITTTEPPLLKSCSYWSPWINDHHPNAGKSGTKTGVKGGGTFIPGDREVVTPVKLRRDYKFCLEGIITEIECREAVTDLFYTETGDNKLTCSVKGGFRCRGKDQESKICKDYKIRYYCACEEITPSPTPIKISTPAIHIEPCTVYYNAIDGPKPVPDSQLKASTSKDFESGPQSARLSSISTTRSAGAWIAGQIDDRQFIEVDLGFIQPIYGVVTKGRHGHPEWVKSYLVLYSRDGNAYAYVTEDGNNPQIFTGNYDSQTPIEHVFNTPFEARFVRIQPLSFQKEIALRFDVLGCAEGMTTPPVYTTSAPICTAEMGLRNGTIKDRQVTTSSNRNPSSDERYIRLKTIQTDDHAGGWVAGELDEYQFVQVDFVTPHEITGIKIQGRDSVPQWVTAFTVSYSQDGNSWDYITDITGTEKKIFPGNYDSDTIVEVYFPYPIRTRYVRINPAGWENWIALRLEILGCFEPDKVLANLSTTVEPPFIEACFEPMGLENHQLPDTLISVSSSAGPGSDKSRLRLNTHSDEQGTGGWIAHKDDYKPIIVIDFTGERNLTAIETQGLEDEDYWVMSYYVHYSSDNVTWEKAYSAETGNWIFDGNRDRDSRKLHRFTEMITARFLKVTIVDYHTWAALRMEVYGCFIPYGEVTMPPPLLITETEFCTILGPWLSLSDPASNPYGDEEQIDQIIAASKICGNPFEIECRSAVTKKDYSETGQIVTCDTQQGLLCLNQNQNSGMCYNYEVRIKCWTCEAETTTTARPLVLCPEVPESLKENCPVSCPEHHSCDGYGCVPDIDCPCFRDGKKFIPPNILVTKNCDKCECVLGGYSMCSPINCSSCLQGQKSELDEYCECRCIGCPDGTITCPTNGACVSEFQWCDGTEDCPDDEINCPTTPPPVTTTTTIAPTTTEAPIICTTEYADATDTCEMVSNMFETFDGLYYQYDICDHLLMREKYSNLYSVTVHKTCSPDNANSCDRYLIITVDNVVLKIGPGVDDVTVQDTRVPAENLYIVSRRFQDFELLKKGKFLVFSSKKYHFDVIWDGLQDARIIVSHCLMNQVIGMCGFYNKQVEDDRSTPDGTIVKTNQEFGDSWSKGPLERCIPPSCPEVYMKRAITTCQVLQDELFSTACADYLKMQSRVETCINYMCECLQRTSLDARVSSDVFYDIYDTGSCKCQAFESFVEACEAVKREPVLNWRLEYDCTPECPPGMEWQDCGPGCELTCDNYREKDTLCDAACTPGCYCPSGTVRHHDKCVKPKMCQDCVCRGHGDPNYITFDGRYYAFQGNCTYVLAQHLTSDDQVKNFRILVTNVECPEEPHTSCAAGLQIFWNGHTIEKFKNKPVYLDNVPLNKEDSPLDRDGISVTYIPNKSTIIHIKAINLAVRYFDQMYGFNVELPAFFYYNKTEGLCGVCNFIQSDDLYHRNGYVTDDVEDFAYSWLVEPRTREQCTLERVIMPPPPPGICNFTVSPCEVFLDPTLYSKSCQNDVTYSQKPEASMCRSKFQYAQQCCERGVSLVEWLKMSGCESSCPEGMYFECTSACQKTCENYKTFQESDCELMPLYTCRCPEGQVMKLGQCVDPIICETCDALGHIVGDVWKVGPCEQCECMSDLSTRCTIMECPEPPICNEKQTLKKRDQAPDTCCAIYDCVEAVAEVICPEAKLQNCSEGQANVVSHEDGCPVYKCECKMELCPPVTQPQVEEGEVTSIEQEGCCPHYRVDCYPEKCSLPPICGPGFKVSTFEGKCCLKYTCVPKKNVCVYRFKYDVLDGVQVTLPEGESPEVEFEGGSSWQDGLCRKCRCSTDNGVTQYSCSEELCPKLEELPDSEKYVREIIPIPGACCPHYRRSACKMNEIVYQIGEEWPSPDGDPCKSYKCVEHEGEAGILEKRIRCDKNCPTFAEYVEPEPGSGKCCGMCKPTACEENGVSYHHGQIWNSVTKPCFKAECFVNENGTQIIYRGQSCPMLPDNCPAENVKTDPKGCCTYCKKPTESCAAVQVPIHETRQFFGFIDPQKGFCTNDEPLEGLTKCSGKCTVESEYSKLIGDFQSVCNCCLPKTSENRPILLRCDDGSTLEKIYQQPLSCRCTSCSGTDRYLEAMNQIESV
ncbi:hemocytin-like [Argiope bruennichi]|nr:hemocytin-like [Argiope bruennichi]